MFPEADGYGQSWGAAGAADFVTQPPTGAEEDARSFVGARSGVDAADAEFSADELRDVLGLAGGGGAHSHMPLVEDLVAAAAADAMTAAYLVYSLRVPIHATRRLVETSSALASVVGMLHRGFGEDDPDSLGIFEPPNHLLAQEWLASRIRQAVGEEVSKRNAQQPASPPPCRSTLGPLCPGTVPTTMWAISPWPQGRGSPCGGSGQNADASPFDYYKAQSLYWSTVAATAFRNRDEGGGPSPPTTLNEGVPGAGGASSRGPPPWMWQRAVASPSVGAEAWALPPLFEEFAARQRFAAPLYGGTKSRIRSAPAPGSRGVVDVGASAPDEISGDLAWHRRPPLSVVSESSQLPSRLCAAGFDA
eukprot:CAMPEP_0176141832 /NCGR_PEP_ID=MMETSP0120_2-20121206/72131_1 /TAXON_ID=160619 /ORGANISM="Kryptoperidinium foliaceum, Strain CCMP 1326" /LENGTH=361 /DNA_ID=CAMNT_0017477995 /DNA_START=14 /DNA_END=1097 /DNA_ORIENTATION=+